MITKKIAQLISIILAFLLLICLFNMPYGYYEFVRFLAMIGFALLAYYENSKNNDLFMVLFIALALLFQPFFKIALGRDLWNVIDVIVAVFLVCNFFIRNKIKI